MFRSARWTPPPATPAPTEDNQEMQRKAEAAAQAERERLKKNKRPTLLTGYGGVQGEPSLSSAALGGKTKLGQ